ncbi:MAG: hypothetical protein ABEK12_00195, partial [Candidatus Nanohaloarchaea archaeon]
SESSDEFEGKSPNRHNTFDITVEPVDEDVYEYLMEGHLPEGKVRDQDEQEVRDELVEQGMPKEEAENVDYIENGNVFLDMSRGVQYLNEVKELIHDAFSEIVEEGPLAAEPSIRLKVKIHDASLHEDAVHRGPAQVMPAIKDAITRGMLDGDAKLFEPKQIIRIDTPADQMGEAMNEVSNRRGDILDMDEEEDSAIIRAKVPVAEMFGFEADLKSATKGKGFYSLVDQVFEPLPGNLQQETMVEIRDEDRRPPLAVTMRRRLNGLLAAGIAGGILLLSIVPLTGSAGSGTSQLFIPGHVLAYFLLAGALLLYFAGTGSVPARTTSSQDAVIHDTP